eukprot:GHVT01081173.1.p1 GENE.GHVT01081173.1~~GHVT01081173.1.p1  ORF type:complete len:1128 (+),score=266.61 GHVT01081173.1:202-3384(+)
MATRSTNPCLATTPRFLAALADTCKTAGAVSLETLAVGIESVRQLFPMLFLPTTTSGPHAAATESLAQAMNVALALRNARGNRPLTQRIVLPHQQQQQQQPQQHLSADSMESPMCTCGIESSIGSAGLPSELSTSSRVVSAWMSYPVCVDAAFARVYVGNFFQAHSQHVLRVLGVNLIVDLTRGGAAPVCASTSGSPASNVEAVAARSAPDSSGAGQGMNDLDEPSPSTSPRLGGSKAQGTLPPIAACASSAQPTPTAPSADGLPAGDARALACSNGALVTVLRPDRTATGGFSLGACVDAMWRHSSACCKPRPSTPCARCQGELGGASATPVAFTSAVAADCAISLAPTPSPSSSGPPAPSNVAGAVPSILIVDVVGGSSAMTLAAAWVARRRSISANRAVASLMAQRWPALLSLDATDVGKLHQYVRRLHENDARRQEPHSDEGTAASYAAADQSRETLGQPRPQANAGGAMRRTANCNDTETSGAPPAEEARGSNNADTRQAVSRVQPPTGGAWNLLQLPNRQKTFPPLDASTAAAVAWLRNAVYLGASPREIAAPPPLAAAEAAAAAAAGEATTPERKSRAWAMESGEPGHAPMEGAPQAAALPMAHPTDPAFEQTDPNLQASAQELRKRISRLLRHSRPQNRADGPVLPPELWSAVGHFMAFERLASDAPLGALGAPCAWRLADLWAALLAVVQDLEPPSELRAVPRGTSQFAASVSPAAISSGSPVCALPGVIHAQGASESQAPGCCPSASAWAVLLRVFALAGSLVGSPTVVKATLQKDGGFVLGLLIFNGVVAATTLAEQVELPTASASSPSRCHWNRPHRRFIGATAVEALWTATSRFVGAAARVVLDAAEERSQRQLRRLAEEDAPLGLVVALRHALVGLFCGFLAPGAPLSRLDLHARTGDLPDWPGSFVARFFHDGLGRDAESHADAAPVDYSLSTVLDQLSDCWPAPAPPTLAAAAHQLQPTNGTDSLATRIADAETDAAAVAADFRNVGNSHGTETPISGSLPVPQINRDDYGLPLRVCQTLRPFVCLLQLEDELALEETQLNSRQ